MTSQQSSILISTVFNSRKNVLDLMEKQGYNIEDYSNFSINEVNSMKSNNQLDMLLEKKEEDTITKRKNKIYIRYYLGKSIRPTNLQEMIDDLFNVEEVLTKKDNLLVVVKDEVNETLSNTVKHIWESENIFIILVPLQHLQFNILKHIAVPPHRVLSESEKIQIKNKYNIIHDGQFPELPRVDPVAKAIGIRPGQVCEINRPSKTAISAPYYRICI